MGRLAAALGQGICRSGGVLSDSELMMVVSERWRREVIDTRRCAGLRKALGANGVATAGGGCSSDVNFGSAQ
jgi:hypothetical protein